MRAAHGVTTEKLLFRDPPDLPRILWCSWARSSWVNAQPRFRPGYLANEKTTKYLEIPGRRMSAFSLAGRQFRLPGIGRTHTTLAAVSEFPSHRQLIGRWEGSLGSCCLQAISQGGLGKNESEERRDRAARE